MTKKNDDEFEGFEVRQSMPVLTLLKYCPFLDILSVETPESITSKEISSVKGAPFRTDDYIVDCVHHGKQTFTKENVRAVLLKG